jgi:hypothetical protein
MSAVNNASSSSHIQQPFLDIAGMIVNLSGMKQDALVRHLKSILSARLGDALDNRMNRASGTYMLEDDFKDLGSARIKGVIATSLKESFLLTPLFIDDIVNDFQNRYSKIASGNAFTYTLEGLRRTHKWKTDRCTSTPHLDPLIQEALVAAVKADSEYVLGFELDMAKTQEKGELVFAIFEKNAGEEISRTRIPASQL